MNVHTECLQQCTVQYLADGEHLKGVHANSWVVHLQLAETSVDHKHYTIHYEEIRQQMHSSARSKFREEQI